MNQSKDCENVFVFNGTVKIPYPDWVRFGPGQKFLYSPSILYCDDFEVPKEIGSIPVGYRNNELSFFLIAVGLMKYPWDKQKYTNYGLSTTHLALFEEQNLSATAYNKPMQLTSSSDISHITFQGSELYPDIQVTIPTPIRVSLGELYGFHYPILLSQHFADVPIGGTSILDVISAHPHSFFMTLHSHPLTLPSISRYMESFVLDDSIFHNVKETTIKSSYKTSSLVAEVKGTNVSVIVVGSELQHEHTSSFIRVFALSHSQTIDKIMAIIEKVWNEIALSPTDNGE